jgi:hypothetical protein
VRLINGTREKRTEQPIGVSHQMAGAEASCRVMTDQFTDHVLKMFKFYKVFGPNELEFVNKI